MMLSSLLLALTLALPGSRADARESAAARVAPRPPAPDPEPGMARKPEVARHAVPPPRRLAVRPFGPDSSDARTKVVIIDAGHGGRDPGRDAASGLHEKTVTLALARRLAAELEDRGYEVHLTRDRDTLIALGDRPRLANDWKRGRPRTVFVSIHANAGERGAAGYETYFLSDARTEDERRVAEMENAAADYEDPRDAREDRAPAVDRILNSLRNDYYVRASDDLAELIQQHLGAIHPGPDRGVKRAGFRVLVGAIMPAVLVETGFMTSPKEARLLGTARFQRKIARSLADAIGDFFARHAWAAEAGE